MELKGFDFDGLMDALKHLNAGIEIFAKFNIGSQNLATADTEQSLLRPLREPIDGCASDEGREATDTSSENLTEG